jgi:hypothetical protein
MVEEQTAMTRNKEYHVTELKNVQIMLTNLLTNSSLTKVLLLPAQYHLSVV